MKNPKTQILIRLILASIAVFVMFEIAFLGFSQYTKEVENTELYQKSNSILSKVETIFQSSITISDGYLSYVSSDVALTKEESEEFLSHLLFYEENFVRNIALLEDTTIKYNYPYEGNESSIGIDLALIDGQKEQVLYVKDNRISLFVGPVELVQGGQAFIIRIPILTTNEEYWGQISLVIDADLFIQVIEEEADLNKLNVAIVDAETDDDVISVREVNDDRFVSNNYTNKYFSWDILVSNQVVQSTLLEAILIRVLIVLVMIIIVHFSYKSKILDWELKYYADHDFLTDDLNRSKFYSDYNDHLFDDKLVAFADINKFKLINDTLGHLFGDWVLSQASERFNASEKFRVYRISGDEFILVSIEPMTVKEFKSTILSSELTFYNETIKQDIEIKLSFGVLEKLTKTINLETILMYLDYAMYDAKNESKTFTIVTEELMKSYNETKILEQQIIDDVRNDKLIPYYQPIINLETGTVDGFEVLSRWLYRGKIQSAATFIDILKRIKYVDIVDRNLFKKIQQDYTELISLSDKVKDMTISINLSAETLMGMERDNKMFDMFIDCRTIPIENIIFEISEDMNLGLISIETLRYMQKKGYNITVDDFGSGVSKLSDVLSGELKRIKTDKSLLPAKMNNDKRVKGFYTVIKAIQASGSVICVEGVETVEQLEISIDAGCKLAQGFLFAKPIPKEEVIPFIESFDYSNYKK